MTYTVQECLQERGERDNKKYTILQLAKRKMGKI